MDAVIATWRESMLTKDVATAATRRERSYFAILPDGRVLTREQELQHLSSDDYPVTGLQIHDVWAKGRPSATAVFDGTLAFRFETRPSPTHSGTSSPEETNAPMYFREFAAAFLIRWAKKSCG